MNLRKKRFLRDNRHVVQIGSYFDLLTIVPVHAGKPQVVAVAMALVCS